MSDTINLLDGLDFAIPERPAEDGATGRPVAAAAPQFFGPYQILSEVGVGGVARVVRARHIHPFYEDKTFALKVLHEAQAKDPQMVGLFRREGYLLALLTHPNIVQTFEAGAQDEKLFIAMEYIDGRDLDNFLQRLRQLQVKIWQPMCLHIVAEVLKGLVYAHELCDSDGNNLHLIHRDVNPANVFIAYDGRVKLGDFGVASITAGLGQRGREVAGKVGYFAPEQLSGGDTDHRVDLFAVGVMLFEMLCGTRLFSAPTLDDALRLNERARIPDLQRLNPEVSRDLQGFVLRALQRRPEARFASARHMLLSLTGLMRLSGAPADITLGLAASMRSAFAREYAKEHEFVRGMAGLPAGQARGRRLTLCLGDAELTAALVPMLQERGHRLVPLPEPGAPGGAAEAPEVVLVDVDAPATWRAPLNAWLQVGTAAQRPGLVALCGGLDGVTLAEAQRLGAIDLLFRPFSMERLLTAVGHAAHKASPPLNHAATARRRSATRLLLVTSDAAIKGHVGRCLQDEPCQLTAVNTPEEALALASTHSFSGLLLDADPAEPGGTPLVQALRAEPGMALVPVIFLLKDSLVPLVESAAAGLPRSQLLGRRASAAAFARALGELQQEAAVGRTFGRFPTAVPGELRHGGRVFDGTVVDLSRGGAMLRCHTLPPCGSEVGLCLQLPPPYAAVELSGQVVRVDLDGEAADTAAMPNALVGIEFLGFAGRGEAQLIAYVSELSRRNDREPTRLLTPPLLAPR